jgi:hypothetical protein
MWVIAVGVEEQRMGVAMSTISIVEVGGCTARQQECPGPENHSGEK